MSIGDIGRAVEVMRKGHRVRRAGWNGKGMWLAYVEPVNWQAGVANISGVQKLPWVGMKTADGGFVPWTCSQADLLATDWELAG